MNKKLADKRSINLLPPNGEYDIVGRNHSPLKHDSPSNKVSKLWFLDLLISTHNVLLCKEFTNECICHLVNLYSNLIFYRQTGVGHPSTPT